MDLGDDAKIIATQLKYLQRAKRKLPNWYDKLCILPPGAYEMASSEAIAAARPWGRGQTAYDLTTGLGVDAAAMARHFETVVTVDRDALFADVAAYNFERLGLENIHLVKADAHAFVGERKEQVDLIFVDPMRRIGGDRNLRLHSC